MDAFLIALSGGSVGAVLTWLLGQGAQVRAVPRDVEEHNRLACERDEDLAQWVADDHLRLERELRGITNRMAAPGPGEGTQLYTGAHGRALANAKERALHGYRDQQRLAERFFAGLAAQEGGWHRAHRRQERVPPLALTSLERIEAVLDVGAIRHAVTRRASHQSR